jgi:hypothetical protein
MAAETNDHAELVAAGWKVGDRAYEAEVVFGDEMEPARQTRSLGLFRSAREAKAAVDRQLESVTAAEVRAGWWSGEVAIGTIVDESHDDEEYGWILHWSWERDERVTAQWRQHPHGWDD